MAGEKFAMAYNVSAFTTPPEGRCSDGYYKLLAIATLI